MNTASSPTPPNGNRPSATTSMGMQSDYPTIKIGEVASSISDTHKLGKNRLIFLNTSDILHGKFLHRSYSEVNAWPGQAKKSIRKDDILFSEIRPANGRWAYVEEDSNDFVVSTKLMVIRSKQDLVYPKFLYQFLTSTETTKWLQHLAESRSGTFPQITFDQVAALELPLPPLAEQKRIAGILGALDDKIELNRRMNKTLEDMARALFQSWFVDFDPVRAKADGRAPSAMDAATATLFPDSFQDSPLGHIPKGWTVKPLSDAIEVNPLRSLRKGAVAPYLDMKNLPTQGHSADEVIMREFGSGTKFQNGDTLLARITPCLENGKTGFVDFLEAGQVAWGSTEYIVFAPKSPLPPQFGYLLARSDALRAHAIQNMTGTSGRQRVPAECFDKFLLAVPPAAVARKFDEFTSHLFTKIKANTQESRTLAALRDSLLPKLLSGPIEKIYT